MHARGLSMKCRSSVAATSRVANVRRPDLIAHEIAETYLCARDGTIAIAIEIEHMSRGAQRSHELGALREQASPRWFRARGPRRVVLTRGTILDWQYLLKKFL
jgi:hypothetical protein